jgi:hypothetical protein
MGTVFEKIDWDAKYFMDCKTNCDLPATNARFISQNVPSQMIAGQPYQVAITMQNNGFYEWNKSEMQTIGLGSQSPADNFTWRIARAYLPEGVNVGVNENETFTFTIYAPSVPGKYNFQWQMLQEGIPWFGEKTTLLEILVVASSIPGDLNADGHVNHDDYNLIISDFSAKYTIFDYNTIVTNYEK